MRLDHLELKHYVPLENTGITSVDADFPNDINVLIGTNGSGKTMLMKTMSPMSLPRTIFDKNGSKSQGYRKQIWSHQGHTYTLVSDYSKPASPHEFYIDDDPENINIGGTSQFQQDLYQTHMGMSPVLMQLIMNSLKFTELSTTARKALLMEINPSKIGFVFDLQKKTASKLKAVKANMARLQDRKLQLEQQLLSDFEIKQMQKETKDLEKLVSDLTGYQHKVEHGLKFQVQTAPSDLSFEEFEQKALYIEHQISQCSDVPVDSDARQSLRDELTQLMGEHQGAITVLEQTYADGATALQLKQQQLESISDDEARQSLESEVLVNELQLQTLPKTIPSHIWTHDQVSHMTRSIDAIEQLVLFFLYSHSKIMTTKRFRRKQDQLEYWTSINQRMTYRLKDISEELDSVYARIKIRPDDIPNLGCAEHKCPLFQTFQQSFSSLAEQQENLERRYTSLKRKHTILQVYLEGATQQLKEQEPIRDKLRELSGIAQTHPILDRILKQENILTILSDTPKQILTQITDELSVLQQYYERITIEDRLRYLHTEISKFKASGDGSRDNLVEYIQNEEKRLTDMFDKILDHRRVMTQISHRLSKIALYDRLLTQSTQLHEQFQCHKHGLYTQHEHTVLSDMKISIIRLRSDTLTRLGEISHTLRDQELLKARYTEEVMGELTRLEKEQEILYKTERGLQEIPRRYIIPFNNLIIEQMNLFLESVWTQDLVLLPFAYDDDLKTYNFPFEKYGRPLTDISLGSEGEQEFLNLIFCLSVRIVLNLRDYPLFLDETGRTFDERHKSNLIEMLRSLINEQIISQLFLINHHAVIHEGFSDADVIVLKEDNIVTPEVYNQNCVFL